MRATSKLHRSANTYFSYLLCVCDYMSYRVWILHDFTPFSRLCRIWFRFPFYICATNKKKQPERCTMHTCNSDYAESKESKENKH